MAAVGFSLIFLRVGRQTSGQYISPGWLPRNIFARFLLAALIVSPFLTWIGNRDAIVIGATRLPALTWYDGVSTAANTFLLVIPLLLGRKFFGGVKGNRLILSVLVVSGVIYAFLALYEIRMSPQLNSMIYGYFPHSFLQHMRSGGFRPIVFLNHGLWLAIFFSGCALAAFGLWRAGGQGQGRYFVAGVWILGVLALSHSLGALIIALIILPLVVFLTARQQLVFVSLIVGIMIFYPALRSAKMVPIQGINSVMMKINPVRASSLMFRILNEDIMLDRARQRLSFGWGGWDRSRVHDSYGRDITVADGYWVITLGTKGWFGYAVEIGLLGAPVFFLLFARQRGPVSRESAVISLLLAGNFIDMIPNATLTPVTWLLAGALWGQVEQKRTTGEDLTSQGSSDAKVGQERRTLSYSRSSEDFSERGQTAPSNTSGEVKNLRGSYQYTRQPNRHQRK